MSIFKLCKFVSFNSLSLYMGEGGKNRCLRLYIGYNILLCVMLLRPRSLPARHSPLTLRRPPSQGPQWAEKEKPTRIRHLDDTISVIKQYGLFFFYYTHSPPQGREQTEMLIPLIIYIISIWSIFLLFFHLVYKIKNHS